MKLCTVTKIAKLYQKLRAEFFVNGCHFHSNHLRKLTLNSMKASYLHSFKRNTIETLLVALEVGHGTSGVNPEVFLVSAWEQD